MELTHKQKAQIIALMKRSSVSQTDYEVNNNGELDVHDSVTLGGDIKQLFFKFGTIDGNFDISTCGISTLNNCPSVVKGAFNCSENNITSLVGGPTEVWNNYYAYSTHITSLEGFPTLFHGDTINLSGCNDLVSLKGIPKEFALIGLESRFGKMQPSGLIPLLFCKFDQLRIILNDVFDSDRVKRVIMDVVRKRDRSLIPTAINTLRDMDKDFL
jgi:hypothetical protein